MARTVFNPVMPRPCPHCPFRTDVEGYLRAERAQEIANSLRWGQSFPCHETVDYDSGEEGEGIVTLDTRHCAGAALVLENEGCPNQLMQVAERLGYYTQPDGAEWVFKNLEKFVWHHAASDELFDAKGR